MTSLVDTINCDQLTWQYVAMGGLSVLLPANLLTVSIGALLFVASDCILAAESFLDRQSNLTSHFVWWSHFNGQCLIAIVLIGKFGVPFGTIEELKNTGNMGLIRSQELRKAVGNLNQKYQRTLRVTELRNILRGHAFPVILEYLIEDDQQNMILSSELSIDDHRIANR